MSADRASERSAEPGGDPVGAGHCGDAGPAVSGPADAGGDVGCLDQDGAAGSGGAGVCGVAGAAVASLPVDGATCAWCGRTRVRLVWGGYVCQYGCADAGHAPYLGHCEDCRAEYHTGNPDLTRQCQQCHDREHRRLVAEYDAPGQSHTGYTHRMRADGANRHAMKTLRGEDRA